MTILPGLTSTVAERIPAFVDDLRRSDVRAIALFPTVLPRAERRDLYDALRSIPGLRIPHVHLRTDFNEAEIQLLVEQFGTERFNIHPSASRHPFGEIPARFASRIFIENVEVAPTDDELARVGGLCPDYSHLESARHVGNTDYVATVERQLRSFPVGCCHVSAIRPDDRNAWNGGPDHHHFVRLSDLDYMIRYADRLPPDWLSLELENPLAEQLDAAAHLNALLDTAGAAAERYDR